MNIIVDSEVSDSSVGALDYVEVEMTEDGPNISFPLNSIDELYKCLKTPPKWIDRIIKLKNRSDYVIKNSLSDCHTENHNFFPKERLNENLQPKTLICHDMKNGYVEDKYLGPVNAKNGYTFYRWSVIDIFVYFSHHLITIPPLAWINLSHKNGVPILGTFITEWDNGKKVCEAILKDVETIKSTVNALIDLCLLFKFDGWLLNIENSVTYPHNLKLFVEYLTQGLHSKIKNSYVIWYDSVKKDGKLKWQNELNADNRCYFDVCDGIFLNYTWTEDGLDKTVKEAAHRIFDVYVGLDVFGRGCFGGGQLNSNAAARAARARNLSLAIFAQAWTHETLDPHPETTFLERFHKRDNIFWNSLWPYLYTHPIKYAFETIFHTGVDSNLYDLQAQTQHITNFMSCDETNESKNIIQLRDICTCLNDNIRNSIRLCNITNESLVEKGKPYVHRLFSTDIFLNGRFTFHCYTNAETQCDYQLVLIIQNRHRRIYKIICHSNIYTIEDNNERVTNVPPLLRSVDLRKNNIPKIWDFKAFSVHFYEDTLLEIGLSVIGSNSISLCAFGITFME